MQTLYVGMGLTQAPIGFRTTFQHLLKSDLRACGRFEVLDFVGLDDGDETGVYRSDRSMTESADVALFVVDHPSIGLGMEIAMRLATGKPMRICAHEGAHITRMLTGMCAVESIPFFRYTSTANIMRALLYDKECKV